MKKLIFITFVFFSGSLHAKYYIGDWGKRPCCGDGCYWFWADVWDDNGTNSLTDDVFVGSVGRLICGLSSDKNGTIDTSKILYYDSFNYPKDNLKELDKITVYPNPVKTSENVYLKNLPDGIQWLEVVVINLSNQQKYQFEIREWYLSIPDWMPKGLYQIIIQSPDQRVYLEQRLVIE